MQEMEKVYDPSKVEERLYTQWSDRGYFHAEPDESKEPFTIVIPPPNITGQLHMGHALDNMMQDALARYHRMKGDCTLWLPGTDHASIATEVKIVEQMAQEGLSKEDVGREAFLERAWAWRAKYGGRIVEQLKKLGSSCDWQRERFTMDEGCSRAVTEVFVRLYEKGLIYRGNRIINWCPDCATALSDAEVEYEADASYLWHIRYPAADGTDSITVATTRPETMLGDTAVAVHPEDERYAHLVGKMLELPLTGRTIPVVADEYVEKDFGSGAVKITPAHDPNDYEVALRHDLPMLRVMDDNGFMNELAGEAYAGFERGAARAKVVEDLQSGGYLVKIEDYTHNVGHCYRCHNVVEPMISWQWFVKMKPLAEPAIDAVHSGETNFVPERFAKTYFNWMENIRDWCISRQLWWGHRIPAYYCECGEIAVARTAPEVCPACGGAMWQDEDVLDTWFSSALWPFSTLGWPEETRDLAYFYPTSVLVTAYDIIFFWVARMIFSGIEHMGETPFHTVLIHGIIRDSEGRKMSKSLGNGIDPLEVIEKYGADALRFSLASGSAPGNDMRFYWEKVESARNFANKIWNASRFVMMNVGDDAVPPLESVRAWLDIADKWILTRYTRVAQAVTAQMERYDLGLAADGLYSFIWSEFCDWYIEMAKPRLYGEDAVAANTAKAVLVAVLRGTMQLLHPFMPFVTEEIYQHLPHETESIMVSRWPAAEEENVYGSEAAAMETVMEMIKAVRNLRAEMNVPPSRAARLLVLAPPEVQAQCEAAEAVIRRLAYASEVKGITDKAGVPKGAVALVSGAAEIFLPMEELVDIEKERARLQKERLRLENEVKRVEAKLANAGFVGKAPAQVVEEERAKHTSFIDMLAKVSSQLAALETL